MESNFLSGYMAVRLWFDYPTVRLVIGDTLEGATMQISGLVDNAHHRSIFGKLEIDHIDEDPTNNRADNLRMCTHNCNMKLHQYKRENKNNYDIPEWKLWEDGLVEWDALPELPTDKPRRVNNEKKPEEGYDYEN